MTATQKRQAPAPSRANGSAADRRIRLIGIDAARGLALIGLMVVHILPATNEATGRPTLVHGVFYGHSAALFAFLAGLGLALSSGGRQRHEGRRMAGDRVGLVVRALSIGAIALTISAFMPQEDPPAYGILLFYSMFFLLALPFLHLGPKALFFSAAGFCFISPLLMQKLDPLLPEWSSTNPTLGLLISEPAGVMSQLLLTGTYPALPYMTYILVGLGVGRLDLRRTSTLVSLGGAGVTLAILSNAASSILLYPAGGYERLLATPGMTAQRLNESLVWGPGTIPDTSAWWLAITTPHTNMPLSILQSLGVGLMVTVLLILIGRRAGRWLTPLAAMGSMTLTLYSAHLLALSAEVHYNEPVVWFFIHLAVAVTFGMIWSRWMGQGPLERLVAAAARNSRQIVDDGRASDSARASGTVPR